MRFVSILTAVVVCAVLYAMVFEREALMNFARDTSVAGAAADNVAENGAEAAAPAGPGAEDVAAAPQDAAATEDPEGPRVVSVVALRSVAEELDGAVVLRGRTEAARQVDVQAQTSGLVLSEPLRKGAEVETGALLCRLEPGTRDSALAEAEARRAEAEAALADAEINATAASRLSQDGFAAETRVTSANAAVQSARAAVQAADAAIAGARTEIERLEIRAPFAGLLESDTAELGALLRAGDLCATVIQLDPIRMVGFAPETRVDRVMLGAPAQVRLAGGDTVAGEVSFVSRSADPATRTFRVEVQAPNPDRAIRDGQTAELLIGAAGSMAHLLPQSALTLSNDGTLGVRLVGAGDVAEFHEVAVLRDATDGVWVTGLADEVAVIVVGQEYVTDGVPVAPTYEEASQ